MKKPEKQQGFTLIELIVGMSIFSIVVVVISGIFTQTVKFQKIVANRAAAIDNLGLAMEEMVRGIRTAVSFDSLESGPLLSFTDYENRKITYALSSPDPANGDKKQVEKSINPGYTIPLPITSSNINITGLYFFIQGRNSPFPLGDPRRRDSSNIPPRITISMTAAGIYSEPFTLQTTVGARLIYYQSHR